MEDTITSGLQHTSIRTVLIVALFMLLRSIIFAPQAQMNKLFRLLKIKYDHLKSINSIDFTYIVFLRLFIS